MSKHTKRRVSELCFPTYVLLPVCLSPQFAFYFLVSGSTDSLHFSICVYQTGENITNEVVSPLLSQIKTVNLLRNVKKTQNWRKDKNIKNTKQLFGATERVLRRVAREIKGGILFFFVSLSRSFFPYREARSPKASLMALTIYNFFSI